MRWRRAAVFAAIVIAHVVVVRLLPIGRTSLPETPDQEVWLAAPLSRLPAERAPAHEQPLNRGARASAAIPATRQPHQDAPVTAVDWAREAEIAATNHLQRGAQAARQAAALARWKLNAIPAPVSPATAGIPWDYSHTHRFEPTPQGLLVNLNDRCVLLINPLALLGGCRLGPLPVHGDLFLHMAEAQARREAVAQ